MFLTSKVEENEQMIKQVCDPVIIEFQSSQNSEAHTKDFQDEIKD